jgi:glucosamine--fructose-6-phosphate aminotransferase (isomerizing)
MCGIFGIITNQTNENIYQIIINALIQLQNRGYDSSGIAILNNQNFILNKFASTDKLSSIDKLIELNLHFDNSMNNNLINIGIGHNRWATHGAKNNINAHPHLSNNENFAIVHNGIIENYMELKNFLIKNGFYFYSQTDTEVIVNLIEYYNKKYKNDKNNLEFILQKVINKLQGTYGIILLNIEEPNKIYCVRNGSPLLIGKTDNYAIITSEQSGFCGLVNTYITLNNYDICTINYDYKIGTVNIKTSNQYIHKKVNILNNDLTPFPFSHWTIKEIYEQPKTILNSINFGGRIKNNNEVKLGGLETHLDILLKVNNIILLGCGTSFNASLYGMHFLKNICNFNTVNVFDGAEFCSNDIPKIGKTAVILLSQSGETKDLHRCIEISKNNNLITIGVINVVDSLIAREVDCGIYCNAGREMGVASTKAFTSQVVCLSLLSIWFAQIHNINENKRSQIIKDLRNLDNDFKNTIDLLNDIIKNLSFNNGNILNKTKNLFILGKGTDEYIAKEGSLKIKEISYIHSEGYSASSLKHGPFALLDENFPVIILDLNEEHRSKILNCYQEVYSRLAPIIFITNDEKCSIINVNSEIINIVKNNSFSSLLGIIPLQLMAYYLSINRGINPDIPKNLAKVVTVE